MTGSLSDHPYPLSLVRILYSPLLLVQVMSPLFGLPVMAAGMRAGLLLLLGLAVEVIFLSRQIENSYIGLIQTYFHDGGSDNSAFGYTDITDLNVFAGIIRPYNSPAAYAPTYEPSLLGRWAHVVAVDSNNDIYGFSNGCGDVSRYWCLAAPGVNISGIVDNSDTALTTRSGTDVAAGHVSGALAVLKSRLPKYADECYIGYII